MAISTTPSFTSSNSVNASSNQNKADAESNTMDYNAFLKLLLAQMQNQDPTQPMDSTEYMAQLANFSNVEQTMKINTKLDELMVQSSFSTADGLIGRTVTSPDGSLSGVVESMRFTSDGPVARLENGGQILVSSGVTVS